MNAALTFGVGWSAPPWSHPITGTVGCCARTASGHAAAVPPSRLMNSRLFTASNCIEMSSWDEIAGQHIKSLHGSHAQVRGSDGIAPHLNMLCQPLLP